MNVEAISPGIGGYRGYPLIHEGRGYIPWDMGDIGNIPSIMRGNESRGYIPWDRRDIGDIPSIMRGNECRGYIPWDKGGYRGYPYINYVG